MLGQLRVGLAMEFGAGLVVRAVACQERQLHMRIAVVADEVQHY